MTKRGYTGPASSTASTAGSGGLIRTEAERQSRKLQEAEARRPLRSGTERDTVDDVIASLRRRLAVEGARKSYLQNCESMQRVHISPRLGDKPVDRVTIADVETVAAAMLNASRAPKTVRNVMTFMHSVFEHAIDRGWTTQNPVRRASRPKRRRAGDANPDIQFLTVLELEAVLRAIPDDVVVRQPAPTRRGRAGSAPPIPPDVLGPVIRVVVLTAAMTGLRQSELLACVGATSTGPRSASACATLGCAASTPGRASPISQLGGRSG